MQVHWPLVISTACQRAGLGLLLCVVFANAVLGSQLHSNIVDFAILRCGYASTYPDKQWHNNVQGCLSTGMPFGVYLYSRATSSEEASKEADFVISQLKSEGLTGADLAFPVYFDMEDKKMVGKNYAAIA